MKPEFTIFDVAGLEFTPGVNLVEASAGTGKTYAIGMLVLRAVVELGVPIEKILIVTFTRAATEELRLRVRARLSEARDLLALQSTQSSLSTDATLAEWLSRVVDHRTALARLNLALYDIDLAAIFTIHGFCQRMLMEQALESGQFFDVELLADIDHVRRQVTDDFWRRIVYPLERSACSLLISAFPTPEKLLESVDMANGHQGRIDPQTGSIDEAVSRFTRARKEMVAWWQLHHTVLYDRFVACLQDGYFKKQFTSRFDEWFQAIDDFLSEATVAVPDNLHLLDRQLLEEELNGTKLRGNKKKQIFLHEWPLSDGEVTAFIHGAAMLLLTIRLHLALELRRKVRSHLESLGKMGFDDLILRLSDGLRGERGHHLKRVLGERFPVALIDEFQDTDSAQWHIFSTLFGGEDHYLYLIGDPKQAIYKFRGADIHSYFIARESAVNHLTLGRNFRSHPFLVEEVNRLFSSRPDPFRFGENRLNYHRVAPAKKLQDLELRRGRESLAGMVYCMTQPCSDTGNGRWNSTKAGKIIRNFVAAEVGRLLDPQDPVLMDTGEQRHLSPADIGILVRSNRQAREYQQALGENNIPAVIGSRQSVFHTSQCREMMYVLEAVAVPGDLVRLKAAMSVPWFGFTGTGLHCLWQDDAQVSRYHTRFLGYNQLWQEQGFLVMMSRLLAEEEVLIKLASCRMAERAIANITHLLELIQERENEENLGAGQILQWLSRMMREDKGGADTELLLESDEQAVQIVTMHSAKGLEYPVVFCPYLWYASNRVMQEKLQIRCHDPASGQIVDFGSKEFDRRRQLAAAEEKAEDLRLLYVALTRAKLRCYTFWADVKSAGMVGDSFDSALGYLLFPVGNCDYQAQKDKLKRLTDRSGIQLRMVPVDDLHQDYIHSSFDMDLRALVPSGRLLYTDWQMSSFSALARLSEYDHEILHEVAQTGQHSDIPVKGLPAGPNFGNVIHDLLESLSFQDISHPPEPERQRGLVKQQCRRHGIAADPEEVERLLRIVVGTPLQAFPLEGGGGFSLTMVPDRDCLKEMAFYYHLSYMATERINDILAGDVAVAPLSHKVMRGYLSGFIDLICRYQGKYYIIDYKTNFLGDELENYSQESLISAMQSHNYGLQYWIYSLVFHRHLKNVLPDYHYHQYFGGIRYLFIRGMSPNIPGNGVYATLPDYNTLLELDRVIGEGRDG